MDDRFARWLVDSKLPVDGTKIESRWEIVESAGKKLAKADVVELLRFFLGIPLVDAVPDLLSAAAKKADPALVVESTSYELRTLAGVVLRLATEGKNQTLAAAAGYGLMVADFGRTESPPSLSGYAADARRQMAILSESIRTPSPEVEWDEFEGPLQESSKPHFVANNQSLPTAFDHTKHAFDSVADEFGKVSKRLATMESDQQKLREELNVLWWLTSEWSSTLGQSAGALGADEASLVLADELAGQIAVVPAPVASGPVLNRMLGRTKGLGRTTIQACVDASPRMWRDSLSKKPIAQRVKGLCPLVTAINSSLSTKEKELWLPVYRNDCVVDANAEMLHETLAGQMFSEALFLKALGLLSGTAS